MLKKKHNILYLILLSVFIIACKDSSQPSQNYVYVDGMVFRDTLDRFIILRGLNYVNKDKANKNLNLMGDTAFREMKEWGYNSVRLGVTWSALEPSPKQYDSTYLQDLDERIQMARDHNLYVILDMHQDLFGGDFGGGAPAWATLDKGLPHIQTDVWSDAYYISPAVQAAFDSFWENDAAEDGIGIQDHYIQTWKMLAQRYKNDNNVVGFDFMNEPFIGSNVNQVLDVLIGGITQHLNQNGTKEYTPEEVGEMWIDGKGKEFILKLLQGRELFMDILGKMEPVYKEFEETHLTNFYRKIAKEIREVNSHHILFWEPSVSSNNGIPTHISRIEEAGDQQAYMPHFYDIVLDTDLAGEADAERLEIMFERMQSSAEKLKMPYLIGEWGAFYSGDNSLVGAAKIMTKGIDTRLIGDQYWSYFRGMQNQPYFIEALQRPYVSFTVGTLLEQRIENRVFEAVWHEDGNNQAPTEIYIPDRNNIEIEGLEENQYHWTPLTEKAAWLKIEPSARNEKRTVRILSLP